MGRNRMFKDYRLRVAEVRRDYGKHERAQAPADFARGPRRLSRGWTLRRALALGAAPQRRKGQAT